MENYVLSASSTADLSAEHFEALGVPVVLYHYSIDGDIYPDDMGKSVPFDVFYDWIEKGAKPTTSQVNVKEYIDHFEKILSHADGLIHLTLSSGISGSFHSALLAKEICRERFPDKEIYVVDSLCISSGFGLLVDAAAERKKEGMCIEELYQWVEENKRRVHHWFSSANITYYLRGGRISAGAATLGTLLNIYPLLTVDSKGRLVPLTKVRGKRKIVRGILGKMIEHAEGGVAYYQKCFLSHSSLFEEAQEVAALVEETFPGLADKVLINSIGTVIGSHTGPGSLALFFFGDKRTEDVS